MLALFPGLPSFLSRSVSDGKLGGAWRLMLCWRACYGYCLRVEMYVVPPLGPATRWQSVGETSYSEKGAENPSKHSCGEEGASKTSRGEEGTQNTVCEEREWDQCQ